MDASYVFAGLLVADRDQAAAWYTRLLGRAPDIWPNDAEAMWQLTSTTSVYLRADPGRAGRGSLTLAVADLEAQLSELAARGIEVAAIQQIGEAGRKAVVTDPDGNEVAIVQLVS